MRAAVSAGADAVYFGVQAFNARQRAENFCLEDLVEVMSWLHDREVRGFLTFNVLVFSDELERAAELLVAAQHAGVDAVIVQDVGLCALARHLVPELVLHGSTQMSITSAAGIAQAAALGCQRVVLARELSLKDLQRLQRQLQQRHLRMPLEVFVHGALCVAYSGQCLTSEALGQRSANRGECAQACRLPYQLVVDGEARNLGDQRYLLSPQDLAAWELVPRLREIGVASFKIEGRLKSSAYVAAVTDAYRKHLDCSAPPQVHRQLELAFSRGLSTGWLEGVNHRQLVHGRWSKKRGPLIGQLLRVDRGGLLQIRSREMLRPGCGLVLEVLSDDSLQPPLEIGGRVMQCERIGFERWRLRLGPGRIKTESLSAGASVWLTSDPKWQTHWQKVSNMDPPVKDRPISLVVTGRLEEPLRLQVVDSVHQGLCIESAIPLQQADQRPLDSDRLRVQLGRLGGTGWTLVDLDLKLQNDLFLPVGELNRMRRALVEALDGVSDQASDGFVASVSEPKKISELLTQLFADQERAPSEDTASLVVLVRSLEQLKALCEMSDSDSPIRSVVADLEQPCELREAVAIARGCFVDGIWLTGARITRPDERWTLEPLIRARPDGYLVRNVDQLEVLTPLAPCIGDFSLNVSNPLSADWYCRHWRLSRVTASYDLNLQQLLALAANVDPSRLEVTLHQHMPLFHMEHCLFCAFLSDGHDHIDCGRPCEKHTVALRDRSGVEHLLRADLGCRNTLFNATAQTGVEGLPALLNAGLRNFRIELLDEDAEATVRRVGLYADALSGRLPSRDVWRQERIDHQLGVTRGSLSVRGPERTSQMHR